jgi:HAD superfamily hydrolase (TIGR01509 family)
MGPIRGVIFDVDGTLIDSNDGHARAWVDALAEAGHAVPYERIRPMIGMGGDKVLPLVAGLSADDGKGQRIAGRREAIFAERYLPKVKALPGARELLVRLRKEGHRLAVASSSKEDMLQRLLALVGAEDLLEAKTSSDDAENSKPDPDIVTAALERLGEPRDRVVMVGDTPYDVEAARAAGIGAIGFRSGGWTDPGLKGSLAIYDGPADLLQHYDESVLAAAAQNSRS